MDECGRSDWRCQRDVIARLHEASQPVERGHLDALVNLALRSGDLAIVALAAQTCHRRRDASPACGQMTLARWAQLEPDNMAAWLLLAEEARRRKDEAAVAEALFRASRASSQHHHEDLLYDAVRDVAPSVGSALAERLLFSQAAGAHFGLIPELSTMTDHCRADAVLSKGGHLGKWKWSRTSPLTVRCVGSKWVVRGEDDGSHIEVRELRTIKVR